MILSGSVLLVSSLAALAGCDTPSDTAAHETPVVEESAHAAMGHDHNEMAAGSMAGTVTSVEVIVGDSGYSPSTIEATAGQKLTLTFKRTTDGGCGDKLVFPDLDIKKDLPLNQPVTVEVTPTKEKTIAFTCGMGMYKGSVVATL